jgi:hypothetical protein
MRRLVMLLALVAGCDRQLNADWCSTHRDDQDCINAGLVQVDAPLPCPAQPCTMPGALICDTGRGGICVECVPGGNDNPPGCHCASDDACHECTVDADCGTGAICLPDYTCVGGSTGSGGSGSTDNLLYAAPDGEGDCSVNTPCTLTTAISMVTTQRHVIQLAAGIYEEGPITIGQSMVLIGPSPGAGHQYRDPSDPNGRAVISPGPNANGPVVTITGGTVALFELTIAGSRDDAGLKCTGATIELYHDIIRDNPKEGLLGSACAMTVERSVFTKNATTGTVYEALYADNCNPIAIRNNFFFGNGNNQSTKGAVHFHGATVGDFRFNSVGYNNAGPKPNGNHPSPIGGVLCESPMMNIRDDVISKNTTLDFFGGFGPGACVAMNSYVGGDAKFVNQTDLHLKNDSPTPAIVNNTASDCSYAHGYDLDFDARPQGGVCDLGADESR